MCMCMYLWWLHARESILVLAYTDSLKLCQCPSCCGWRSQWASVCWSHDAVSTRQPGPVHAFSGHHICTCTTATLGYEPCDQTLLGASTILNTDMTYHCSSPSHTRGHSDWEPWASLANAAAIHLGGWSWLAAACPITARGREACLLMSMPLGAGAGLVRLQLEAIACRQRNQIHSHPPMYAYTMHAVIPASMRPGIGASMYLHKQSGRMHTHYMPMPHGPSLQLATTLYVFGITFHTNVPPHQPHCQRMRHLCLRARQCACMDGVH